MEIFIILAFASMVVLGAPQGPANFYGLPSTDKSESAVPITPAQPSLIPSIPLAPAAPARVSSIPLVPAAPAPVAAIPLLPAAPLPSPVVLVPTVTGRISSPSPVVLTPSVPFSSPSVLAPAQGAPSAPALTGPSSVPTPDTVGQTILAEEIVLPKNSRLSIQDQRGQYSHGFSDNEGTQVSEQGRLITTNGGWEYVIAKKGSYSYISPEGKKVTVNYIADENGFRVLGELVS